jgi:hypothetical protein
MKQSDAPKVRHNLNCYLKIPYWPFSLQMQYIVGIILNIFLTDASPVFFFASAVIRRRILFLV